MSRRPIDFQGLVALDQRIVEQLNRYLYEKEARLACQISGIIQPIAIEAQAPILNHPQRAVKLSEAVEEFSKKIRQVEKTSLNDYSQEREDQLLKNINQALWEFTEVLEGCVVELFQQIKQINLDKWRLSLSQVVQEIKDILIHRIEDLIWTIRRLEKPLKEYSIRTADRKGLTYLFKRWKTAIDPNLLIHLQQSETLLKTQFQDFQSRYRDYGHFSVQIEGMLEKMKEYPVLAVLDLSDQNLYIDAFRLLKFYELNPKRKESLSQETVRSLKNLSSIDGILQILRVYFQGLKEAFFNSSLELKALDQESENPTEAAARLQLKVQAYHHELQQLIRNMTQYRDFVLKTNPNPYIRSRWGFTEWTVGPEPAKTKELLELIYSAEELKTWYDRFLLSLNRDPFTQQRRENYAHQEIDRLLHEMGQPLISRTMMHNRVERLLEQLKECDEIGTRHVDTIRYIQEVLGKAMREDWKYHVLNGFKLFREIYEIHCGLVKPVENPSHRFRMEKFHELFNQIEEWVNKEDIYSHVHEIELDINDMKAYLQDFLASVQRATRERSFNPFIDEHIEKFQYELMQYRYAFGRFFYNIMSKDIEGQQLRNQFLFVDQYFEAAENLIQDMAASWGEKNSFGKER